MVRHRFGIGWHELEHVLPEWEADLLLAVVADERAPQPAGRDDAPLAHEPAPATERRVMRMTRLG